MLRGGGSGKAEKQLSFTIHLDWFCKCLCALAARRPTYNQHPAIGSLTCLIYMNAKNAIWNDRRSPSFDPGGNSGHDSELVRLRPPGGHESVERAHP